MEEKTRLRKSIIYPVVFVCILWIIEVCKKYFHLDLSFLGVRPHTLIGLVGIFTGPFIHGDYDHLLSNTIPLLVSGIGIIYFYKEISKPVFVIIWLFTGFWVWIAARPESHIGASGLIYGFVCFLFFSGVMRQDKRLLAISLLVTFLYGSMVWGILPVKQSVSWESHFFGSIAGLVAAFYFRKEGPQGTVKVWEDETEPTGPEYWMTDEQRAKYKVPDDDASSQPINYIYKEKED